MTNILVADASNTCDANQAVFITAINHSGEYVERIVTPISITFGTTERHSDRPQFFAHVFDHEKQDYRDFALSGILTWEVVENRPNEK